MPSIYSYQKIVTRETSKWLAMPYEIDGSPLATELVTIAGTTYVSVADGATLPEQPEGIVATLVTLTPELIAQIKASSPHARLIAQQQQERLDSNDPLSAEKTALWAAQQYAALGLATETDVTQAALAILAARRYQAETAGTIWNGHPVATDRQSQALVMGALLATIQTPSITIDWKMADGSFVTLAAADVDTLAQAVRAHVQAAFDNEKALIPVVTANLDADISEGWPS